MTKTAFKTLQAKLYATDPANEDEARRRTHRTSRLITKLRAHGLIGKVKNPRLYRVAQHRVAAMWAAIRFPGIDFPSAFNMPKSLKCNFSGS